MTAPAPPTGLPPPDPAPARPKPRLLNGSFLFMVAFAVAGGVACYTLRGPEVFWASIEDDGKLFLTVVPVVAGAILLASFAQVLMPTGHVKRWLGQGTGLRGLLTGTVLGAFLPGGPMASFPLMLAVIGAGADYAVAVAVLNSWALFGIHRLLVWELPLMGGEFVAIKMAATIALPILSGWLAALLFLRFPPRRQ